MKDSTKLITGNISIAIADLRIAKDVATQEEVSAKRMVTSVITRLKRLEDNWPS